MLFISKSSINKFYYVSRQMDETYDTSQINKELLDDFADYLHIDRKLTINTVKGIIQRIKFFLKKLKLMDGK